MRKNASKQTPDPQAAPSRLNTAANAHLPSCCRRHPWLAAPTSLTLSAHRTAPTSSALLSGQCIWPRQPLPPLRPCHPGPLHLPHSKQAQVCSTHGAHAHRRVCRRGTPQPCKHTGGSTQGQVWVGGVAREECIGAHKHRADDVTGNMPTTVCRLRGERGNARPATASMHCPGIW